jgi:hypothetical protein
MLGKKHKQKGMILQAILTLVGSRLHNPRSSTSEGPLAVPLGPRESNVYYVLKRLSPIERNGKPDFSSRVGKRYRIVAENNLEKALAGGRGHRMVTEDSLKKGLAGGLRPSHFYGGQFKKGFGRRFEAIAWLRRTIWKECLAGELGTSGGLGSLGGRY